MHDASDLPGFAAASFEAVVAGCNLLDVYDDQQRRRGLCNARRVLVPGGVLIMSSPTRAYLPRRIAAHWVQHRLEMSTGDYALSARARTGLSLVHYYIAARTQRRQLIDEGLEPLAVLDRDGSPVGSDGASDCPEIHDVAARPRADGTRWG